MNFSIFGLFVCVCLLLPKQRFNIIAVGVKMNSKCWFCRVKTVVEFVDRNLPGLLNGSNASL